MRGCERVEGARVRCECEGARAKVRGCEVCEGARALPRRSREAAKAGAMKCEVCRSTLTRILTVGRAAINVPIPDNPSSPRSLTSRRITSGFVSASVATPASTVSTPRMRRMSGVRDNAALTPSWTTGWSSTIRMRIMDVRGVQNVRSFDRSDVSKRCGAFGVRRSGRSGQAGCCGRLGHVATLRAGCSAINRARRAECRSRNAVLVAGAPDRVIRGIGITAAHPGLAV